MGIMLSKNEDVSTPMMVLSTYIAGAAKRRLPADVLEKTKHHVLDTLAAMISGSRLKPGGMAIKFARSQGGKKEATVIGTKLVTSSINASMANGMLAHADETDDSHQRGRLHPGCATIPAALAVSEREGKDGRSFLKAVAAGYDLGVRVNLARGPKVQDDEGHSAHTTGSLFGATAAVGSLMNLNPSQVRHMFSYACQQASGIPSWTRDPEHIEKAFDFGGMPARDAVTAATIVGLGFTGVEDVFSGARNFFDIFSDDPRPQELVKGLGTRYEIMDAQIKKWSVGMPNQAVLDSLEVIIAKHKPKVEEIKSITISLPNRRFHISDNVLMPDICTQHLASIMLLDRTMTFATSHNEARMKANDVMALRKRITLVPSDALAKAKPMRQAIAEIELMNGKKLKHRTRAVHGTPQKPMTRDDIEAKSLDLIAPIVGKANAQKLFKTVWSLEKVKDMGELRPLLQA